MPHPLVQVALDLGASLTCTDRFSRLVSVLRHHLPADAAQLMCLNQGVLRPMVVDGLDERTREMRFRVADHPTLARFVEARAPLRVKDGPELPGIYAADGPAANQAPGVLIGAPLLVEDEVVGVLTMSAVDPAAFDEVDDDTILGYAALAAAAMRTGQLMQQLEEAADHRLRVAQQLQSDAAKRQRGPLLGESAAVRDLRAGIARHAASDGAVLLVGPPGAGKEPTARAIHEASARSPHAFIHVTCALTTTQRLDTLLGRATSYVEDAPSESTGKFDLADGGTIYLAGVDQLPHSWQGPIARVIERFAAVRAAGGTPEPDVRIIASATAPLEDAVRRSGFDLGLARSLDAESLRVPPLRERKDDIPAIVDHFVREQSRMLGKAVEYICPASMERLQTHSWPGNIGELRRLVERTVALARGRVAEIDEQLLDESIPLGRYRLVEQLASGGMGEVWMARHELLRRPAAVKLIRPESVSDVGSRESVRQRFEREAQVTATLRSPHTVTLYDFGVSDTGDFYYVMELLDGLDLDQMVRRFGPLRPERVVYLLRQACLSLGEAHGFGLIHRDIKPANIFVARMGPEHDFAKVLDFGMVKRQMDEGATALTAQGTAQGTPAFIAPELALGDGPVDDRADLYSLGATAYWMLTGQLVFEAPSAMRMMMHHIQTPATPPSEITDQPIPAALEAILMGCLAKPAEARPRSALELWRALGEVPLSAPWTPERAQTWWRRHLPELAHGASAGTRL